MQTLIDNDTLKVSVIPHDSEVAVLCFTGVGFGINGVDIQSEEFYRVSSGATAIFIIDKQRSWGNSVDFAEIRRVAEPYIAGKRLYSIGNSMGGFLAVLASRFFDLAAVVAFVPQHSVSSRIVPEERRWPEYVSLIKEWKFESLDGCFAPRTHYYILTGADWEDGMHTSLFPSAENVHKIIFHDVAFFHNVAVGLKGAGLLYEVISGCFNLHSSAEIVSMVSVACSGQIDIRG